MQVVNKKNNGKIIEHRDRRKEKTTDILRTIEPDSHKIDCQKDAEINNYG